MKIKASELTGPALAWAVCEAEDEAVSAVIVDGRPEVWSCDDIGTSHPTLGRDGKPRFIWCRRSGSSTSCPADPWPSGGTQMRKLYDGDKFSIPEAPGHEFRLRVMADDTSEAPWERCDGHGPVRCGSSSDKRPGERLLCSSHHSRWYYDWQAACKLARKDGWNTKPYDAPNQIERAVQADFDYLRRWLNNDWCYIGVCVELLDEDGDPATDKYANAVWGIESESDEYIAEVAIEMANQCAESEGITLQQRSKAWRGALHEARERRYWASRDVATT